MGSTAGLSGTGDKSYGITQAMRGKLINANLFDSSSSAYWMAAFYNIAPSK